MQEKDGCRTRGNRTEGMQDMRDAGKERCSKGGMKGRRDEWKEG